METAEYTFKHSDSYSEYATEVRIDTSLLSGPFVTIEQESIDPDQYKADEVILDAAELMKIAKFVSDTLATAGYPTPYRVIEFDIE